MRGARAFVVLTGTLLLLATISYALYRIVLFTSTYTTTPLSPQIGQTLFIGLAFLELIMVCFITPAVTAGAISGEREKLTYEMLMATPLRPASILWGKLISALSYVLLLIFAAIPIASLAFTFGGVAPRDMLKVLVILVTIAVTLGTVGMFMSTWLGRTGRATVASYLVVLALLAGPLLIYILVGVLRMSEPPRWILVPNPLSALYSALTSSGPGAASIGPTWGMAMVLGGNLGVLQGGQVGIPRPLYHYTLPLYAILSLALYLLATWLVQPIRRWRVRWQEMALALVSLLAFLGVVALAFALTANRYQQVSIFTAPTPVPAVPAMAEPVVAREAVQRGAVQVAPPPTPSSTELPETASPSPNSGPNLSQEDQAAIYATVARQLYTVDHTFGDQPPNFPVVYLVRRTDDSVGDPNAPQDEARRLSGSVQTAIVAALEDLPAKFVWVDSRDEVPMDANSTVKDGGTIFTLGNIHPQPDGSLLVSGSLYFSSLGAGGRTYILKLVDGSWQIVGDTGVVWIS